jgi:hypothetical protein
LRVGGAERFEILAIAIDLDEPLAERVVEERSDGVAENAAKHRSDGADERIEPCLRRIGKRHWHEDDVGRNGEERAFGKGHGRERRQRIAPLGKRDHFVVKAP